MQDTSSQKNEYAKHLSLFLAELLRTRKIDLYRAAEIAQKVVENINLVDSEQHFLKLVKELTLDFQELNAFDDRVHFHIQISERKDLEQKVRAFVVNIMTTDENLALQILQESTKEETKLQDLCGKFPLFKQFIETDQKQWTKTQV